MWQFCWMKWASCNGWKRRRRRRKNNWTPASEQIEYQKRDHKNTQEIWTNIFISRVWEDEARATQWNYNFVHTYGRCCDCWCCCCCSFAALFQKIYLHVWCEICCSFNIHLGCCVARCLIKNQISRYILFSFFASRQSAYSSFTILNSIAARSIATTDRPTGTHIEQTKSDQMRQPAIAKKQRKNKQMRWTK